MLNQHPRRDRYRYLRNLWRHMNVKVRSIPVSRISTATVELRPETSRSTVLIQSLTAWVTYIIYHLEIRCNYNCPFIFDNFQIANW